MAFYANTLKTSAKPQRFLAADTEKKVLLSSVEKREVMKVRKSRRLSLSTLQLEPAFDCYTF
jgi:hypothetical protein